MGSSRQLTASGMAALANPLECVVTKNAPVSALESVLTKAKDLNCPGINTYKKPRGSPPSCYSGHPQTVTLSNTGSATLNIASVTLAGAFLGDHGRCQRDREKDNAHEKNSAEIIA